MKTVLAFDFGASSGRAIKGVFDGKSIKYSEIHRFENIPQIVDGHVCHDVDMIFEEIKTAIRKAGRVDSILLILGVLIMYFLMKKVILYTSRIIIAIVAPLTPWRLRLPKCQQKQYLQKPAIK